MTHFGFYSKHMLAPARSCESAQTSTMTKACSQHLEYSYGHTYAGNDVERRKLFCLKNFEKQDSEAAHEKRTKTLTTFFVTVYDGS
jgi:hypothetical protein